MYVLTSHIEVGDYTLAGVVSVNIDSSWEMLTDTATILIPSEVQKNGQRVNLAEERILKRGDRVLIQLGYDGNLRTVFKGFVDSVKSNSPIEIYCQDETYLLKKKPLSLSYSEVTLEQLLTDIIPKTIAFKAIDINLGSFRITQATPAQVLDKIRERYGLYSYMKGGVLYCGFAYNEKGNKVRFAFGKNIISDDLEYRFEDELLLKAKTISMLPSNKKIEVEIGDPDGELRTFHFYNISSKYELRQIAQAQLLKLKYTGYHGTFESFGEPVVEHGDEVEIEDSRYNRNGIYLVKKVTTKFGNQGFRQVVKIDRGA